MKKLLGLLAVSVLVGCEDMEGTFKVFQPFHVNTKEGLKTIPVGNFESSLDFKKEKVVVTLMTADAATRMTIRIPQGTKIPANGEFLISAAEAGQPFAVSGTQKTIETRGSIRSEYESCSYTYRDVVCDQHGCREFPVTRWGHQYTEYYNRTVEQELAINALDVAPGMEPILATFSGATSQTEKVILRKDSCF